MTQFKVEMQTVTAKAILYEMDGSGKYLAAGDTLEHIVHHEIKELGQHVLACTITYRLPPNSRSIQDASEDMNDPSLQTFRKFYKFAVGGWTNTNQSFTLIFEYRMVHFHFIIGYKSSVSENQGPFIKVTLRIVINC